MFDKPVRLLLHGIEPELLGGPTLRVPLTTDFLRKLGVPANWGLAEQDDDGEDLVHIFNAWDPVTALTAIRKARAAGKTIVFSPIFLDLRQTGFWAELHRFILPFDGSIDREALASAPRPVVEHPLGYHAMVREMVALSDHVILLSECEKAALTDIGVPFDTTPYDIVHNPVDVDTWADFDPALFEQEYGSGPYVLCLGRVEWRKNQLLLADALRDVPVRLVLIGHEGDPAYGERIRKVGHPDLLMLPRMEPAGPMLRSAIGGAAAVALPSWAEGASLAALEAGAAGANLVLSDMSSEREYFGPHAHYCDPGSPDDIRKAVEAAIASPLTPAQKAALQDHLRVNNSWDRYVRATAAVYAKAQKRDHPPEADWGPLPNDPLPLDAAAWGTGDVHADITVQTGGRILLRPVATPEHPIEVVVTASGIPATLRFDNDEPVFIDVEAGTVRITATPAFSPAELGLGTTKALCGFGVLASDPVPLPKRQYELLEGWKSDAATTWSQGRAASLAVHKSVARSGTPMVAHLGVFQGSQPIPRTLTIRSQGHGPVVHQIDNDGAEVTFPMPKAMAGENHGVVWFELDQSQSPYAVGLPDERRLGLSIHGVSVAARRWWRRLFG